MSYRGSKGWRPNSRRNRRGGRSAGQPPRPQGSNGSLFLLLGLFTLALIGVLALVIYNLR
ncbi:MAG: hypothetical protein M3P37_03110 [Actinomycetota bacterium]|nr:hypothetical protein [Actinomycetota bacterium]